MSTNNYYQAFLLARQCYDLDTLNLTCLEQTGTAAIKAGSLADAKHYFHLWEKADSNNVYCLTQLATIYENQKNLPKAIKYYSILKKMDENNPLFYRKLGRLFRQAGEVGDAFKNYSFALAKNPHDLLSIQGIGDMLIENRQAEAADSIYSIGLSIDSENPSMIFGLAKAKYMQQQYDSVVFVMMKTRGLVDLNTYYSRMLGYSYLKVDSFDLAIRHLTLSISDVASNENSYYYLARAYEKKEELKSALHYYQKAIDEGLSESLGEYHRNMARIHEKEDNLSEAIHHYKEAHRFSSLDEYLYYLARTCDIYYKDKNIAIRYYQKYIKSNHDIYDDYAKARSRYLKEQMHFVD